VVPNNTMFSPRDRFNYAIDAAGSEQIRGGIGQFAGRTPYVWISNQYGNTGLDITRLTVEQQRQQPRAVHRGSEQAVHLAQPDHRRHARDSANENRRDRSGLQVPVGHSRQPRLRPQAAAGLVRHRGVPVTSTVNDVRYENRNLKQIATSNIDGRPF
jgi:hypothetical protein